ncbi:hypothetical protein ACT7DN_15430 [Bacillus paranthracis]
MEYISWKDEWLLITPNINEYRDVPLFEEFMKLENGTLVVWRRIDTFSNSEIPNKLDLLRSHLSLVFHCFLEGKVPGERAIEISVNGQKLKPLNPFNPNHIATQQLLPEKNKIS